MEGKSQMPTQHFGSGTYGNKQLKIVKVRNSVSGDFDLKCENFRKYVTGFYRTFGNTFSSFLCMAIESFISLSSLLTWLCPGNI